MAIILIAFPKISSSSAEPEVDCHDFFNGALQNVADWMLASCHDVKSWSDCEKASQW